MADRFFPVYFMRECGWPTLAAARFKLNRRKCSWLIQRPAYHLGLPSGSLQEQHGDGSWRGVDGEEAHGFPGQEFPRISQSLEGVTPFEEGRRGPPAPPAAAM